MRTWNPTGPEANLYNDLQNVIGRYVASDMSGTELFDVLTWTVAHAIAAVVLNQREAIDVLVYVRDFDAALKERAPLLLDDLRKDLGIKPPPRSSEP